MRLKFCFLLYNKKNKQDVHMHIIPTFTRYDTMCSREIIKIKYSYRSKQYGNEASMIHRTTFLMKIAMEISLLRAAAVKILHHIQKCTQYSCHREFQQSFLLNLIWLFPLRSHVSAHSTRLSSLKFVIQTPNLRSSQRTWKVALRRHHVILHNFTFSTRDCFHLINLHFILELLKRML